MRSTHKVVIVSTQSVSVRRLGSSLITSSPIVNNDVSTQIGNLPGNSGRILKKDHTQNRDVSGGFKPNMRDNS